MTDKAPIKDPAWAFTKPMSGCGLAGAPANARLFEGIGR